MSHNHGHSQHWFDLLDAMIQDQRRGNVNETSDDENTETLETQSLFDKRAE